jgi:phenylacetate-coenzyme A ligase PaaK-like adenylate-forming protein
LTSLYNYRTPLIRYLNGDAGKLIAGEKYTEIEELSGRTGDMFVKKDGSFISSAVAPHMIHISGITQKIKRYQFIQYDTDQIEFRYELFAEPITAGEFDYLKTIFSKWFGQECRVEIVCTGEFIQSGNGKHRLMINRIAS